MEYQRSLPLIQSRCDFSHSFPSSLSSPQSTRWWSTYLSLGNPAGEGMYLGSEGSRIRTGSTKQSPSSSEAVEILDVYFTGRFPGIDVRFRIFVLQPRFRPTHLIIVIASRAFSSLSLDLFSTICHVLVLFSKLYTKGTQVRLLTGG